MRQPPFDRKIHTSKQVILSESPVFYCTSNNLCCCIYTGILLTKRFWYIEINFLCGKNKQEDEISIVQYIYRKKVSSLRKFRKTFFYFIHVVWHALGIVKLSLSNSKALETTFGSLKTSKFTDCFEFLAWYSSTALLKKCWLCSKLK